LDAEAELSAAEAAVAPLFVVVALAGAREVVEGGFEEDTAESEAAGLVNDGADEEGGETETEEKIFEGCYYIKNRKLASGTHYSRGYRGRQ
jgi:hypothetical protein